MNYAQTLGERAKVAAPAIANASPKLKNEALAPIATSRFEIRLHKPFRVFDGAGVFKIFCDFFVGREFVRQEIQRLQLFAGERNRTSSSSSR